MARGFALVVAGFGSADEHARVVAPIRTAMPPAFELVTPMPYTQLQQLFNGSAPWGLLAYEKALYLDELSDNVISVFTEFMPRAVSPLSFVPVFDLSGAYAKVADDATAFGGSRSAAFVFYIAAGCPTPRCTRLTGRGCVRSGMRCGRTPRARVAMSTSWPRLRKTGYAPRTAQPNTPVGAREGRIRSAEPVSAERQHQAGAVSYDVKLVAGSVVTPHLFRNTAHMERQNQGRTGVSCGSARPTATELWSRCDTGVLCRWENLFASYWRQARNG